MTAPHEPDAGMVERVARAMGVACRGTKTFSDVAHVILAALAPDFAAAHEAGRIAGLRAAADAANDAGWKDDWVCRAQAGKCTAAILALIPAAPSEPAP